MAQPQNTKRLDTYDHTCTSVTNCAYLQRLCKALQFYQSNEELNALSKYFEPRNYNLLLTDYHHIIDKHLDNKPVIEIQKEFESIHNIIMKYIHHCSLDQCTKLARNHRHREKQSDTDDDNNTIKNKDAALQFCIDTMDTIHCYFVHSFDIGFRLKADEISKVEADITNDEKKSDSYLYKDIQMEQLRDILDEKRKKLSSIRGMNRMQHNKFLTKMQSESSDSEEEMQQNEETETIHPNMNNNEHKDSVDEKIENKSTYSFGHRYYYWDYYRNNDEKELKGPNEGYKYKFWFINRKYSTLKSELLCNKILTISPNEYQNVLYRASENLKSEYCRRNIIPCGELLDKYEIPSGSLIKVENIIAVIVYCDYDTLSYEFSKTFRKIHRYEKNASLKTRNSEFWNWSKILRETVECYGTYIMDSDINVFYHGVSYLQIDSFVSYFCAPTSTTAQICVATTFAKNDGLILELGMDDGRLTYFYCSWLSSYGNEDERLFFGGYKPLGFRSVRSMKTNENYKFFIKSFALFNYVITKDYPLEAERALISKTDYKIIKKLMNKRNDKFPEYIMETWNAFCLNKKVIKIRIEYLHKYYNGFLALLMHNEVSNLLNFDNLCLLFRNCSKVQVDFAATRDVRDNNMSNRFISALFCQLQQITAEIQRGKVKLRTIQFRYAKYQNLDPKQDFLDRFQKQFQANQWSVSIDNKDLWIKKSVPPWST